MNESEVPTIGQLVLLGLAILAFAGGGVVSLMRVRNDRPKLRLAAKAAMYLGILLSLAVLVWHSAARQNWIPITDNFDTLLWLAVLLAMFVMYLQRVRPLSGLEWFAMPIVILLLIAAGVFGRAKPHEYLPGTWTWTHRVTSFGGLAVFFIAGVAGVMYLIKTRQLRTKHSNSGAKLPSLERLEHFTYTSVTLGFALLTIGLVTGLVRAFVGTNVTAMGPRWYTSPTVLLTFAVWLVYAIVLHAPINPSFRGRRAAILSVFGLVLTIGTLIAVQYVPSEGAH
jgi:ABC-type transport system involved in cytochrome c biogenesis permease subunit